MTAQISGRANEGHHNGRNEGNMQQNVVQNAIFGRFLLLVEGGNATF